MTEGRQSRHGCGTGRNAMADERSGKNDRQPAKARAPRSILATPVRVLIAAAVIGAIVGLAIGFSVFQSSGGHYNIVGFVVEYHRGRDAMFWLFGGAIVAGAIAFLATPSSD